MHLSKLVAERSPFISLEFFPPKQRESWPGFFEVVEKLKPIDPLFVSVTYGAGGGTQDNTLEIATRMKQEYGLEPVTHLTCVGASEEKIGNFLDSLKEAGIENILALRGDAPKDVEDFDFSKQEFQHATDLVEFARKHNPDMCVGVAGYPGPHPESPTIREDLKWNAAKLEMADFMVTQLFFDNRLYFELQERMQEKGLNKPIIPGILPIMTLASAKFILSLCGAAIPGHFLHDLEAAHKEGGDDAVYRLGMDFAVQQCQDLLDNGAPGVHLYTLNKADACLEIASRLKL